MAGVEMVAGVGTETAAEVEAGRDMTEGGRVGGGVSIAVGVAELGACFSLVVCCLSLTDVDAGTR